MTDDLMPGCEPFSSPGTSMGVLVLHGFTGNPYSMRPLAERIAEVGYSVELPRLPGHGTSLDDLVPRRWSDFVEVALNSYDELAGRCEKVAVVGLSVGGGLTAMIAEERPRVVGCVFINPMLKGPGAEMEQGLRDLIDSGLEVLVTDGESDIKKEGTTEAKYEGWPLRALQSVIAGVEDVAKLARLTMSEDELDKFTVQLSQVLDHASDMNALQLDDVVATAHPFGLINVVREDVARACLDHDEVMAMAPDAEDGRFAVPRILGEAP